MKHTITDHAQLRLRVFAGPNGSGKSTVINSIGNAVFNGKPLYLGTYVNADDIAAAVNANAFTFSDYDLECSKSDIVTFAFASGLLAGNMSIEELDGCFQLNGTNLFINNTVYSERLAQVIARFLREKLLEAKRRFSFETVFSHESNLDIMRRAAEQGYKVYLYFVSTEDPEINKYRVELRVKKNGHNVPPDKVESRYYRSLGLVKEAAEIAYQAFFFDNSINNEPYRLVGHFKKIGEEKVWDEIDEDDVSKWFYKYCV